MTKRRYLPVLVSLAVSAGVQAADPSEPIATGKMMGDACAACHGTHGKSYNEYMPQLAGIEKSRFIRAMQDYREDKRVSVIMNRVAKGYNDAEIAALADYFSRIK